MSRDIPIQGKAISAVFPQGTLTSKVKAKTEYKYDPIEANTAQSTGQIGPSLRGHALPHSPGSILFENGATSRHAEGVELPYMPQCFRCLPFTTVDTNSPFINLEPRAFLVNPSSSTLQVDGASLTMDVVASVTV